MKTIKFWTSTEIKAAKTALKKIQNVEKTARWLSVKLNRPVKGVAQKLYQIKRDMAPSPKKEAQIIMPESLKSFEIIPKKITMYNNRMIVEY